MCPIYMIYIGEIRFSGSKDLELLVERRGYNLVLFMVLNQKAHIHTVFVMKKENKPAAYQEQTLSVWPMAASIII